MTVLARDAVASDHLVYAWPFPIGPECEVSCAEDEQVVMCPAWMVGDRLGPGRHRWRTPDPTRPVMAFFVLTAPVEVSFDMVTSFLLPTTGQPVRLRAQGSLQVRCADPGLLIAQFVGLPFDRVNDGVLRSVSRSVERMLARLLTRRVVMSGTPIAVTEAGMLPGIIEELIAYNPTAGAVFGVELIRMGYLVVAADDGQTPFLALPARNLDWSGELPQFPPEHASGNGHGHHGAPDAPNRQYARPQTPVLETIRGMPAVTPPPEDEAPTAAPVLTPSGPPVPAAQDPKLATASGEIVVRTKGSHPPTAASGEIRAKSATLPLPTAVVASKTEASGPLAPPSTVSGEIRPKPSPSPSSPQPPAAIGTPPSPSHRPTLPLPPLPKPRPVEVQSAEEITQPGVDKQTLTPMPGSMRAPTPAPNPAEAGGSIMGIGVSPIPTKVPPGARVLVPGPNGLMQSATVRQLLQGYYELEVGSSGETIWVPIGGVVPE